GDGWLGWLGRSSGARRCRSGRRTEFTPSFSSNEDRERAFGSSPLCETRPPHRHGRLTHAGRPKLRIRSASENDSTAGFSCVRPFTRTYLCRLLQPPDQSKTTLLANRSAAERLGGK